MTISTRRTGARAPPCCASITRASSPHRASTAVKRCSRARGATRGQLRAAAREESDHLAWCAARLDELGGRTSLLSPFWYAGSFCIGLLAGASAMRRASGFVAETERQVEAHLTITSAIARRRSQRAARSSAHGGRRGASRHDGEPRRRRATLPSPIRRCMGVGGEMLRRIALFV